ncbi:MAG: hypothetical protein K1X44_07500 [Alphaproteobacteria bacterium]|nr:hypothetical protein [Alphaproteobacteria bacterium]
MCSIPFKPKKEKMIPPPTLPSQDMAEIQMAEEEERKRARLAKGRATTLLIGGDGDTTSAPSYIKKLLGQ